MATGDLYSWGTGTNLQLESGEEDDVWTPAKVSGKKIENRKVLSTAHSSVSGKVTVFFLYIYGYVHVNFTSHCN